MTSKLDEEAIKNLVTNIQSNIVFKKVEEEISSPSSINDNSKNKISLDKQKAKIRLLEGLINMDPFSKALMNMYETNPKGGSLDQLSKMAGMSRIMIGWNLRKFVKAGLLKLENNEITFLD